jgi:hypothetical protein
MPMTTEYTTSTVYTTKVYTITECPYYDDHCRRPPYITTETVVAYTTVCPITYYPPPPVRYTTSTVYTTYYRTVTECEPYCPETPYITTESYAIYTTVCPVEEEAPAPTQPPKKHHHNYECVSEKLTTDYSTSTVYTTQVKTMDGCTKHNKWCDDHWCPETYCKPYVTTKVWPLSTTLSPEVKTEYVPCPTYHPAPPPPPPSPVCITTTSTSTLYTTKYYTVTACPHEVDHCHIGQKSSTVYATATTCYTLTYTTTIAETTYTKEIIPSSTGTSTVYASTKPTGTETWTTKSTETAPFPVPTDTSTRMTKSIATGPMSMDTSRQMPTSNAMPKSNQMPTSAQKPATDGQKTGKLMPASMPTAAASMKSSPQSAKQGNGPDS